MAFVTQDKGQRSRENRKEDILQRAFEKMADEPPMPIVDNPKPFSVSQIKNACPRQVYYMRHARGEGISPASAPAVFGTVVHGMFNYGNHSEELWDYLFRQELIKAGAKDLYDPSIRWTSSAKPFGLSAFRDASPEGKIAALYKRYYDLDRLNYENFWEKNSLAIYRHPPTGRLAEEARVTGEINGAKVRGVIDLVLTDVYDASIMVADWKTGFMAEEVQLATYALLAEQQFGLEPGCIEWGFFIHSGAGECFNKRGKLPFAYAPDFDANTVKVYLEPWRGIAIENVRKLQQREKSGKWTPKLNTLCYNACDFRHICPVGQAVREVKSEADNNSR